MVNHVILVGRLTRDAERVEGAQTPVTRMRLATDHGYRDGDGAWQEKPEFHTVVSFGRLAEVCAAYCAKGRLVYVAGRLRSRDYDGSDGLRRHTTEVVADVMKLLGRPPSGQAPDHAAGPREAEGGLGAAGDPDPLSIASDSPPRPNGRRTAAPATP